MSNLSGTFDRIKSRQRDKTKQFGRTLVPRSKDDLEALKDPRNRPLTVAGSLNLAAKDTKASLGDVETAFTPEIPEPEEQTVIPIPDDSLQANEARRRRARRAQTGRQSTRLTEGLGG